MRPKIITGTTLLSFIAPCIAKHPDECPGWAESRQCKKNREYMKENCWKRCSQCKDVILVLFSSLFESTDFNEH